MRITLHFPNCFHSLSAIWPHGKSVVKVLLVTRFTDKESLPRVLISKIFWCKVPVPSTLPYSSIDRSWLPQVNKNTSEELPTEATSTGNWNSQVSSHSHTFTKKAYMFPQIILLSGDKAREMSKLGSILKFINVLGSPNFTYGVWLESPDETAFLPTPTPGQPGCSRNRLTSW